VMQVEVAGVCTARHPAAPMITQEHGSA
jgi:hypothetical protein